MTTEIKEEFCGACLAVPMAMLGAGISAYGAKNKPDYKSTKNMTLWIGIGITIISIIIGLYFILSKCEECK